MILRRIAVRHFKGLRHVELKALSDRLNLFYGPNESGKSTLVEAIHFGLFERSAGEAEHKRAIRTWGGTEAPEVELDVEDDSGRVWSVHKRFLLQPSTELTDGFTTVRGEDAEKRLRALFGTQPGNNRGVQPDQLGIWPLLWVRQGRSGVPVKEDTHAAAHERLSATLAQATGEIAAGGRGEAVRARVRALYEEHHTATGGENIAFRRMQDAAREARARAAELQERLDAARQKMEELARSEKEVEAIGQRAAEQRVRAESAQRRATSASQAAHSVEVAGGELALRTTQAQLAEQAEVERRGLEAELGVAEALVATCTRALADAERVWTEAEASDGAAQASVQRARVQAELARRTAERVAQQAERALRLDQVEALAERIARAEQLETEQRVLADQIAAVPLALSDVARLEELTRSRDQLTNRLADQAPRLVLTALADTTLDGRALPRGAAHTEAITAARSLTVGDVVRVEVHPPPLATTAELARAEQALAEALAALAVRDLGEALALREAKTRLEADRKAVARQLGQVAPEGTEAFRRQLGTLRRRLEEMPSGEALPEPEVAAAARASAEEALASAEGLARLAQDARTVARGGLDTARERLRAEEAALRRLIARREALPPADRLALLAKEAREARAASERALGVAEAAFREAGGPEAAELSTGEAAALASLEKRLAAARQRVAELRAELRAREEDGLFEAWQEAVAAAAEAEAVAQAVAQRARVRRALHEALESSWSRMRDRFVEPVRKAIEREVPMLFPGSRLWIDEAGDVVGLVTGGIEERFDQLSGGAREQLGVLVRLGLARVLAGESRLPVILDDALVNSDTDRRARMVEVLRRMSEHLQILVFTCHDEDFDGLGAAWQNEVRGRPGRGR